MGSCSLGGIWRTAKRKKRTSYGRNGGPIDREGCGVPQNEGNGLVLEHYGRNGGLVHPEGCGVPQNGTPQDTIHLHRRPPPASTGYYSSTVDLLQPPPTTVHPRAPIHLASTALYSTGYCSTNPLHGLLFNHPSTGYCSSSPPPATVQPALHRLLFNQPSTSHVHHPQPARSIGVLLIQRQRPLLPRVPIHPTPPQQRSLFIQRQHRSASVSNSSEGITHSSSVVQ